jgi:Putative addiction module component
MAEVEILHKGGKTMNTIEIAGMSKAEKLQTMEALWDSLVHEDSEMESPKWHQPILEVRKQKIEEGKAEYLSIEELRSK